MSREPLQVYGYAAATEAHGNSDYVLSLHKTQAEASEVALVYDYGLKGIPLVSAEQAAEREAKLLALVEKFYTFMPALRHCNLTADEVKEREKLMKEAKKVLSE